MSAVHCLLQTWVPVPPVTLHCTLSCDVYGVTRMVQ